MPFWPDLLCLLAGGLLTAWLAVGMRRLRDTTLLAPLIWTAIAGGVVLLMDAVGCGGGNVNWRYFAAVGTLCPAMALLGAKRPQDRGWQFIVASLWLVLSLPLVQRWVFSPHSRLELHPAWQWFLLLLIAMQVINHLPTRFGAASLLIGIGQSIALAPFLPIRGLDHTYFGRPLLVASGLFAIAASWIGTLALRQPKEVGWNRVWLDFRDQFGCVWALRVRERINHAAQQPASLERLQWHGFDQEDPFRADPSLETTTRMLLRRFVSPEWIARRIGTRGAGPE